VGALYVIRAADGRLWLIGAVLSGYGNDISMRTVENRCWFWSSAENNGQAGGLTCGAETGVFDWVFGRKKTRWGTGSADCRRRRRFLKFALRFGPRLKVSVRPGRMGFVIRFLLDRAHYEWNLRWNLAIIAGGAVLSRAERAHGPDQPNRCRALAGEVRTRPVFCCARISIRLGNRAQAPARSTLGTAGQTAASAKAIRGQNALPRRSGRLRRRKISI